MIVVKRTQECLLDTGLWVCIVDAGMLPIHKTNILQSELCAKKEPALEGTASV